MDRLPPELWARVCSLSDIRSLKRIRLVNSTFTQIAARYLFEELCVILIPKYLDKVTEVAFHPSLRFYVRTLYFDYDILDEDSADYEEWKLKVDDNDIMFYCEEMRAEDQNQGQSQLAKCSQADLKRHHTNFYQLLASQKACFDGRMDLAILSAALAMLPNLRAIKSMVEAFDCRATSITSELQSVTLVSAEPALARSGLARPLASLISALGLTRKQILTIDISDIPWSFWEDNSPSGFLPDVQQFVPTAFRHLESMVVTLYVDINDLEARLQGLLPTSITTFIGAAQRLRSLDLSFFYYEGEDDGPDWPDTHELAKLFPHAGQLFAALTLPNLVEFRLASCRLPEKILEDFIARHASTLKNISMSAVALDNRSNESTSWEKTLKFIAPILFLDRVALWSLYCDDILNVILAGDPDDVAHDHHQAYCKALEGFLLERGRTACPRTSDYAKD